jgi:TolB-like protein/Flp pilus assembly protein TadD
MEWAFGAYILNSDRAELTGPDGLVHIERQPLDLLVLLARNADRVVTKDELIDQIWQGRAVSDTTLSTAIKQARKAVGDTGAAQSVIRTIHGRGFRFVAPINAPAAPKSEEPAPKPSFGASKPSIAVLPFQHFGDDPLSHTLSEAVPAELITSMSRLHWLQVIARGSSFRFPSATAVPEEVGAQLGVRYILTGTIETMSDAVTTSVDLLSTKDGRVIWSDRFDARKEELRESRRRMVAAIIVALEIAVPKVEAEALRRVDPMHFDAWSHFHLGLKHMFRFNPADNDLAQHHFLEAVRLDPDFSRAHAGVSFTHWQKAFMHFGADRNALLTEARTKAETALQLDPDEPFANFNMGRALWLNGDVAAAVQWYNRALEVNPNFAQGYYAKALATFLSGDIVGAEPSVDQAMTLSPLDPLHYAMTSTKAMICLGTDRVEEATQLTRRAVNTPGAHFYIHLIAAMVHDIGGHKNDALNFARQARELNQSLTADGFFQSFPVQDKTIRDMMSGSLARLGF